MANTTELDDAYKRYLCTMSIVTNAQQRSLADPHGKFIETIGLPLFGHKSKNLRGDLKTYFDEMQQKIVDLYFLDLVAIFEKIIFNSIGNASGLIKNIVRGGYDRPAPFHMASESFVKKQEDIYNLSGVKSLVSEKLPREIAERLSEILEHRNWLAHGKRIGKQSTIDIAQLHTYLKDIIEFVHE